MLQRVTFLTVPANAISHTTQASGQLLSYEMIVGIEVGNDSVAFQHPDYGVQVDQGSRPSRQQIMMPTLMAARLIPFARANFVEGGNYDSSDFTKYVSCLQATPQHSSRGSLQLSSSVVTAVSEMRYHVIATDLGEVVHSFIGLRGQRALSVLGHKGTFGISHVADLMRVYGCVMLGRLDSASAA